MALTKKAIILFEPEQYEKLKKESKKENISVGSLIRKILEKEIFNKSKISLNEKIAIAKRFISAKEKYISWDKIEKEITKRHLK